MTRKSPYKHHVHKHTRKGKPVHDYDRGMGDQEKKTVKAVIRKIWKQGEQKMIGIPKDAPLEAGDMCIVIKIDEGVLTLPSNTESYLRVYLDKDLK